MVISQAPVQVTGYIWYGVFSDAFGGGWIIEDVLAATTTPPPPSGKFQINDKFRVTSSTNLRATPSTSGSVITTMGTGTTGTVIGGPSSGGGYIWWNVRLSNGTTGWCIENWLVETDGGTTPPPSGKFQINDKFRVTETMNLRSSASTSASVVQSMPAGTTGTVIGGPTSANGYVWWNVRLTSGTTGWAVENWLVETDGGTTPPPPSGKFQINDKFRVTSSTNLRTSASTSASIVTTMSTGTTGTVIGGPTSANGYTWWNLRLSNGTTTGWSIENWLVETDGGTTPPPTGRFAIGDTVSVTESANFRTGAGTTNSVIRTLRAGETGTVKGGPTSASGYTWWQLTIGTTTGWVIDDVLQEGGGTTPPPSGSFPVGTTVQTNDPNVRLRSSASTSGTILYVLPEGARLTIVSGPTSGSGYSWYRVSSTTYGTGYIVQDFIERV
jgi:N-acetylmuramoyl-L-alanine amidase